MEDSDGKIDPGLVSLEAALRIAFGGNKQASSALDASAEDLSQRISKLEISSRERTEHADLMLAMRRQMNCLLQKKACADLFAAHKPSIEMARARQTQILGYQQLLRKVCKKWLCLNGATKFHIPA